MPNQGRTVEALLLTQRTCKFCAQARALLAKLAEEYPLRVREVDLDSARGRELAGEGGILFPPGIFLNGRAVAFGRPSERRLRRELDDQLAA